MKNIVSPAERPSTLFRIFAQIAVSWPFLSLALLVVAGCATKPSQQNTYTFFPPSPDEPRIQFLTSFSSDIDLGK